MLLIASLPHVTGPEQRGDITFSALWCYVPLKTLTAIIQRGFGVFLGALLQMSTHNIQSFSKSLLPRITCPLTVSFSDTTKMPSMSGARLTVSHGDIDAHYSQISSP